MRDAPFVSVIIPVWNSPAFLQKCLSAITSQSYPKESMEVIVVDNGSTDSTPAVARSFPFVTLYEEPIASSYRARNLGLRHARGDYVMFTDADCVPDRDWVASAVEAARRYPEAGVLAGRITLFRSDETLGSGCEKFERVFAFDQAAYAANGACVTANWMSPRKLLLDLNGFNAALRSGGDMEFSRRIQAAGHPVVYVPEMVVQHPVRGSVRDLIGKRRRVIGGEWMKQKGRLRIAWLGYGVARACAAMVVKALTRTELGILDRLHVASIVVRLSLAEQMELVRLAFGGEPRRA